MVCHPAVESLCYGTLYILGAIVKNWPAFTGCKQTEGNNHDSLDSNCRGIYNMRSRPRYSVIRSKVEAADAPATSVYALKGDLSEIKSEGRFVFSSMGRRTVSLAPVVRERQTGPGGRSGQKAWT